MLIDFLWKLFRKLFFNSVCLKVILFNIFYVEKKSLRL